MVGKSPRTTRRCAGISQEAIAALALLIGIAVANPSAATSTRQAASPVSVISIPVRFALGSLTATADETLPYEVGHWRGWKDWHGVSTQYRAWRGPLQVFAQGDLISVQAHIRYWVRARKELLGVVNLKGECGVGEPPRQAVIGTYVRLGWGPDWTLQPQFRLLPTRFLDRCEMTAANIDVTPLIELEFRSQMEKSLREAVWRLGPVVAAIQRQAERTWSLLHEPVELAADSWLLLRPRGIALSPMMGRGDEVQAQLALALQPLVITGARPDPEPTRLPPLGLYRPRSPELSLQLSVDLDFANLERQLTAGLSGRYFDVQGRRGEIAAIELGGSGQELRAKLGLTEDLAGTVELRGQLAYDTVTGRLELKDLEYDYTAENVALGLLANAFYESTREELETLANQALAQQLESLRNHLAALLKESLPPDVTVDLSTLEWRSVHVSLVEQGMRLEGLAGGSVRLALH